MIVMSVDVGTVRTGIAVSDENEKFAFPKAVITERNREKLVLRICEIAKDLNASEIVVGLPKNMDGSLGFKAEECTALAEKIKEQSGLTTNMWDERCTTVLAHSVLSSNEVSGKKRKEVVDSVAAVMILEDYLKFKNK